MFLIIGTMILTTTLMITLPLEIMEEPPPIQAHRATQPTPLVQWDHSHHRLQAPVTLHMHSLLLHQEVIQVTYIYTSAIYRSPVGVKVVELKWQQFLKKMCRFLDSTNFNLLFCSVIRHVHVALFWWGLLIFWKPPCMLLWYWFDFPVYLFIHSSLKVGCFKREIHCLDLQ